MTPTSDVAAIPAAPADGSPMLPAAPAEVEAKQSPVAALPDAIPELADLPTPAMKVEIPAATPAPVEQAAAEPTPAAPPLNIGAPPTTLPGLNLPLPPMGDTKTVAAPSAPGGFPTLPVMTATSLPEIDVAAPAPTPVRKTWETKLAPSSVNVVNSFNYRRQVLPDAIYKTAYDRENRHLPTRVTAEDYDAQLAAAVAHNDVNATRALLNARRSLDLQSAQGQGLVTVARNYGATDTERLLIARGAR